MMLVAGLGRMSNMHLGYIATMLGQILILANNLEG
jgi:hypothetical protein